MDWRAVRWTVAPGLGHVRVGRRAVGFTLLAVWVGLLVGAASMLGTARSWMLAFASISVHSLSFSLLISPVLQRMAWQRRIVVGMAMYAALIFGLYYPVRVAATHAAHVVLVRGVLDNAVCRDGDALLYTSTWTRPGEFARGDLVVYQIEPRNTGEVVIHEGVGIDRIVGVAGDHVMYTDGLLLVNGVATPDDDLPLHGLRGLPNLDVVVGEGEYLIFPTNLQWLDGHGEALRARTIRDTSRVSAGHVLGRVFARAAPWPRAGRL
ncbi:MAG: hypothetical protein IPJ41_06440 [Phycisphaerales bacterium]|nr:hypothetical protein [Phycisphaerales bacterium]